MIRTLCNWDEVTEIQSKGYSRIRVHFHTIDELADIKDWCRENCSNNVYINADDTNITASYLYFEREQDALLYKLSRV